ncbi:hypothetical protein N0V90_001256 [Kalmusia sp. IMI 367209]|nr:hypothetical protein N0V90_001256 [Kalmusia sp. IMI 367209]
MPTHFFSLPSEIRNTIYELLVLQAEPIIPWDKYWRVGLTSGLFRVNKAVHRESTSLFYSHNRFDFTVNSFEEMDAFFRQIGDTNAHYIQHICLEFPMFVHRAAEDVAIEADDARYFNKLRQHCSGLSTLTTSVSSTSLAESRLGALDSPELVVRVLKLVDELFKSFSSLHEVIVEVYEDGRSDLVRREMEVLGWTVRTTEHFEDTGSERRFDDSDESDLWDGYDRSDGYDDYDYDIDNDSDFWRRAGD